MKGFDLVVEDVYAMQQTCAYEVGFLFDLSVPSWAEVCACRLWRWDIPSSVSCSRRANGMGLIMRE
jgi:hypothetical protein